MKKQIMIFVICLFLANALWSQSDQQIDSLIIQGKQQLAATLTDWSEESLMQARAYFERLLADGSYPWLVHYYIGFADYRLVSFYFSKDDKDKADRFIEDGIEQLQKSIELKDDFAEAHSLLSSIYGNKIAVSPMKAITLGPKSGSEMSKAMKLEPDNPRTHLIAGQSAFFTPKLFGGGKDKAKEQFEKAIKLFEPYENESPLYPDWGHDEAYGWLGLVYAEQDDYENAIANYKKALQINPDYGWVKYVLLPEAEKKIEGIESKEAQLN